MSFTDQQLAAGHEGLKRFEQLIARPFKFEDSPSINAPQSAPAATPQPAPAAVVEDIEF
jgi:hypothetical protein